MTEDLQQLRLLGVFYYIVAGLTALCASFPVIHLVLGIAILTGAFGKDQSSEPSQDIAGWLFILCGGAAILIGWTFTIGLIVTGRLLRRQRGYAFCLVMAALACTFMPFGTVLGVLTLIVLVRPSVKKLFGRAGGSEAPEETVGV
jgi:hypothetical protein